MFGFVLFFIPTNRFAGRPGDYVYVFNQYRMEEVNLDICGCVIIYMSNSAVTNITVTDTPVIINYLARETLLLIICFPFFFLSQCAPGGCLIELCIQLSIIMLGKQLIQNNVFEIGVP